MKFEQASKVFVFGIFAKDVDLTILFISHFRKQNNHSRNLISSNT